MKQSTRLGILKFIALIEITLFVFVISFVLRKAIFGNSGSSLSFLLFFLIVVGGSIVGNFLFKEDSILVGGLAKTSFFRFLAYILNIKERELFAAKVIAAITTILPILAVILVYRLNGILSVLFEVVFAVLPYRIAIKSSCKHYQDIMVNAVVYFGFFVLAAALVASSLYNPLVGLKLYIYIVLYVYILIFLILKNQEDIDDNIYSKKYIQKSILPRNMRSFNLIAVLVLFTIILLVFNLKNVVTVVMGIVGRFIAQAVIIALWILSHIFPESSAQQGEQAGEKATFPLEATTENHPILNIIFMILAVAVILFLLYKLMPVVYRKLVVLFSRLMDLLKRVLNLHKVENNITEEYDDETETIRPEKGSSVRRALKRKTRKAGKELDGISDPVERVRYIYGLILNMLDIIGVDRKSSDTVSEIYQKSEHFENIAKPLFCITKTYEKVRYGDFVPESDEMKDFENRYTLTTEAFKK